MTGTTAHPIVTDAGVDLRPDADRTIVRFFVPGHEDVGAGDSRAGPVIERILAVPDADVEQCVDDLRARFEPRHHDIIETFERHSDLVSHRNDDGMLSPDRRRLLGAAFTHEYAIEAAALCNPSMVRHPEQPTDGSTRFVMSVRGIGEGHRSSIGFRTGIVRPDGTVHVDAPEPRPVIGERVAWRHDRAVVHRRLADLGDDHENASYVLDLMPGQFDDEQLEARITALADDARTRRNTASTISNLRRLATCSYKVEFDRSTALSERVLWPRSPVEYHGMEDARFVEMTDGAAPRYCATYTAFDGVDVNQHLLTTEDFLTFTVSPLAGAAAMGKGLALFPRRIGGRYFALSRFDRETNSIAVSDDMLCWDSSVTIQTPGAVWEVLQLGNCGSPIETSEGWLVLTHGVGPMRTYAIGAILLDLDDPRRVLASGDVPLLTPVHHRGYVPNVVYSCGAMAVDGRLVLPYGLGDQSIAVATMDIAELIASMRRMTD